MILPAFQRTDLSSLKKGHACQFEQQFRQGSEFAWILSGGCDANPRFWSVVGRLQPPAVVYVCMPANCESAMPVGRPALQNTCFAEYNADGSTDLLVSCMQRLTIFFCFQNIGHWDLWTYQDADADARILDHLHRTCVVCMQPLLISNPNPFFFYQVSPIQILR